MVFSSSGRIYYVSESVTSLLGYLPNELENTTIYDITYQDDQSPLYNVLLNPAITKDQRNIKQGIVFFFSLEEKNTVYNMYSISKCCHHLYLQRRKYPFPVILKGVARMFRKIQCTSSCSLSDIFVRNR